MRGDLMQLDRVSVAGGYAAGRKSMQVEMQVEAEQLRAQMQQNIEDLQAQMAALHRALMSACKEAELLREWWDAHCAHQKARRDLLAVYRKRALEDAWV